MTHTVQPTDRSVPSSPERSPWWRRPWLVVPVVVVAVAAAVVVAVTLWRDDEAAVESTASATGAPATDAPAATAPAVIPAGEAERLVWATATEPPSGQVLAVTAMDGGYLAAAHTAAGVEFWVSDDGDAWTLLATDPEAFRPNYEVRVLDSGPAGFTAEVFDPTAGTDPVANTVFASTDGATWYRTELTGDLPESPSPYAIQHSVVHGVTIGADGFLAFGSGSLMPDFDRIAAEYAPGHGAEDVWAVDAERRPEGAVLIVGFGDEGEAPLEIPFSELGIEADDLAAIFEGEGEGEEPAMSQYLWWSGDGANWELLTPQGLSEFWRMPFMGGSWVGADDGFYLFPVGPDPASPEGPGAMSGYHSIDGRVWTRFDLEAPSAERLHIVYYGEGVFVAVGEDDSGPALWTSADARVWERARGSETLFDLGDGGEYEIEEVDIGGAGFVAVGLVFTPPTEPVIVKDGYAVMLGEAGIAITDEATGQVEVLGMETGRSATIQMLEDETGLTFVDIDSGETLLVITHEEIDAAMNAGEEPGAMAQPPAQVFRYSTDLATWTLDPAAELFGEGSFAVSGDMDGDTVLAVAASDRELWHEQPSRVDLPATVIWIGTPAG